MDEHGIYRINPCLILKSQVIYELTSRGLEVNATAPAESLRAALTQAYNLGVIPQVGYVSRLALNDEVDRCRTIFQEVQVLINDYMEDNSNGGSRQSVARLKHVHNRLTNQLSAITEDPERATEEERNEVETLRTQVHDALRDFCIYLGDNPDLTLIIAENPVPQNNVQNDNLLSRSVSQMSLRTVSRASSVGERQSVHSSRGGKERDAGGSHAGENQPPRRSFHHTESLNNHRSTNVEDVRERLNDLLSAASNENVQTAPDENMRNQSSELPNPTLAVPIPQSTPQIAVTTPAHHSLSDPVDGSGGRRQDSSRQGDQRASSRLYGKVMQTHVDKLVKSLPETDGLNAHVLLKFLRIMLKLKQRHNITDEFIYDVVLPYASGLLESQLIDAKENQFDFQTFHSNVLDTLIPLRLRDSLRSQYFQRLQKHNEPLPNYIEDIKIAAQLLRLGFTERAVVEAIVSQLTVEDRNRVLSDGMPKSYDDLTRACLTAQNFRFAELDRRHNPPQHSSSNPNYRRNNPNSANYVQQSQPLNQGQTRQNQGAYYPNDVASSVNPNQNNNSNLSFNAIATSTNSNSNVSTPKANTMSQPPSSGSFVPGSQFSSSATQPRLCFLCKSPDHLKRDCPRNYYNQRQYESELKNTSGR